MADNADYRNLVTQAVNDRLNSPEYLQNIVGNFNLTGVEVAEMIEREKRWELAKNCFACLPTIVSLDLLQYQNVFEH